MRVNYTVHYLGNTVPVSVGDDGEWRIDDFAPDMSDSDIEQLLATLSNGEWCGTIGTGTTAYTFRSHFDELSEGVRA